MFGVIVAKTVNSNLFQAFADGINYISKKYNVNQRSEVQDLFEKEYKLRLQELEPTKNGDRYYFVTFDSEQDYFYFLLRWT